LLFWWFCFYLYFAVPWVTVMKDFPAYNRANYSLVLVEQSAVVLVLLVLWKKTTGTWHRFYGHAGLGLLIYALANFLQGVAMAADKYYSGSIYDVPLGIAGIWIVYAYTIGSNLQPAFEPPAANSERQGLWTARLAMVAMISLPVLGIYAYLESNTPAGVLGFRLRLIFGAMLFLGSLGFFKLYVLDRELQRLISVTEASYESLKTVQERIAHSEKLAALGRLASGAAHEINNPLTAIYGYSELLSDNPALSPDERRHAREIQEQVRRAQSAVFGMRESANRSPVAKPHSAQEPSSL
jgi:signal transduction histidine kinase